MSNHAHALQKIQSLFNSPQLASLGPEPRSIPQPLKTLAEDLHQFFSETEVSSSAKPLIRSLVLLWHDYLDESHSISQGIHDADGSFLHGIMHRREPDYGNAKYWFHKVGAHPCYPTIAAKAGELMSQAKAVELKAQLIPGGSWDAFAFVDACEQASKNRNPPTISLLEQIQEIEFRSLLNYFLPAKEFVR